MIQTLLKKTKRMMKMDEIDPKTAIIVEPIAILRLSTKHINLWVRQLETKRKEACELSGLTKLERA